MGRLDSIPRSVRFTAQQQSLLLLSSDFRGFLVLPHGVYQAICPPRWDLSEPSLLSGLKHSCLRPEQQKTPSRICRHGQRRSGVPMSFVTLPPPCHHHDPHHPIQPIQQPGLLLPFRRSLALTTLPVRHVRTTKDGIRNIGKGRNSKVRTSVTTQGCNRRDDIRVNVFRSLIPHIPVQNTNARHLASKRDDQEAGSGSPASW